MRLHRTDRLSYTIARVRPEHSRSAPGSVDKSAIPPDVRPAMKDKTHLDGFCNRALYAPCHTVPCLTRHPVIQARALRHRPVARGKAR